MAKVLFRDTDRYQLKDSHSDSTSIATNKSLQTELSGIPDGALITDGNHTFMSTALTDSVDISNWNLAMLSITLPENNYDPFSITITATSPDNTQAVVSSQPLETALLPSVLPQLLLQLRQRVTKLTLSAYT